MNKKIISSVIIVATMVLLTSCWKTVAPAVPPEYETVTVTDTNMSSNHWTGSSLIVGNPLFSFDVQNNKFVVDKDLDNFNDKYSMMLKSKDSNDMSYVWFKFFSVDSLEMDYQKDIERELQTKINYVKKPVDLKNCIIDSEGSEKWPGWVYIKKCEDGQDYLVQLLNKPYEQKDWKKAIGYKAYALDKAVRTFIIWEYFAFNNNINSFDLSEYKLTKNTQKDYSYDDKNSTPVANWMLTLKEGKNAKKTFYTKKTVVLKWNFGIIMDSVIDWDKATLYDMNFEITKNLKILWDLLPQNIPGKFADYEIFKWLDAKYNIFLLFRKPLTQPKNLIEFVPRFPNTFYVKTFIGKSNTEVATAEDDFINNFSFKPWYEGKRAEKNTYIYSYSGQKKTYILIIWRNEKDHKEYAWKYVYAEVDKQFLSNNIKTYLDFLWKIK